MSNFIILYKNLEIIYIYIYSLYNTGIDTNFSTKDIKFVNTCIITISTGQLKNPI